ncbi:hypothetical protein IW262DRAFT_1459315 [Armillaria fumosa]|nr:hypothetical protein IW262DRAFT_1459315 [Armillaria fumosa]
MFWASTTIEHDFSSRHDDATATGVGGKLNCIMSIVDTVQIIKEILLTDDGYLKAGVLGWGIELGL